MEQMTIIYIIAAIVIVGLALGLGLGLGLKKDDDNGNNNNNNDNKITYTYVGDENYKNYMNIEDVEGNMYDNSPEYKQAVDTLDGESAMNVFKNNIFGQSDLYLVYTVRTANFNLKIPVTFNFLASSFSSVIEMSTDKIYIQFNYKKNGKWVNDPDAIDEKGLDQNDKILVKNKIEEIESDPSALFYRVQFGEGEEGFQLITHISATFTLTTNNMPFSVSDENGVNIYHMLAIKD